MRRCYITDVEDDCTAEAEYEARLNWTNGVMLLCAEHAARERASQDVIWIRYLRDDEQDR